MLAVSLAAGIYLGLGGIIGKEAASWLCLLVAAPVAIAGFFHYNGMTLEQFPKVLILFVLPKDETEWLTVTSNEMVVKRCAWWCSLKGLPKTENEATKRISIPIAQIFTPSAAIEIMEKVKGGHEL